jgi:hypothetical protein
VNDIGLFVVQVRDVLACGHELALKFAHMKRDAVGHVQVDVAHVDLNGWMSRFYADTPTQQPSRQENRMQPHQLARMQNPGQVDESRIGRGGGYPGQRL